MKPTIEQQAIVEAFVNTSDHLFITARAGSAKTTTLEMCAKHLQHPSLYLAFNKAIATEAGERMPPLVASKTFNALGHRAIGIQLRKRLIINKRKNYEILKAFSGVERASFQPLLTAMAWAKSQGYHPDRKLTLQTHEEFLESLPIEIPQIHLLHDLLIQSWEACKRGKLDFDDQIYYTRLAKVPLPVFSTIFVDEAQDLSPIQQSFLRYLAGFVSRTVVVADPAQAIYGFRGATDAGLKTLSKAFKFKQFTLTVNFRCDPSIIKHANWRTGDMKAGLPSFPDSKISINPDSFILTPHPSTFILCRYNAPLFRLALLCLKAGYLPSIRNKEIVPRIAKILRSVSSVVEIERQCRKELQTAKEKTKPYITDLYSCASLLFNKEGSATGAVALLNELKKEANYDFYLSTYHGAKGLEADRVILLNEKNQTMGAIEQEHNVLYVAQTRARRQLHYCDINTIKIPKKV